MKKRADGGLHGPRLAEHRAELIEDVRAVVHEDTAAREIGLGSPLRCPVRVARVRCRPAHVVLGEVDAPEAREQVAHHPPVGRVVVLMAGLEDDARGADGRRDVLGLGERGSERLLAERCGGRAPPPARSARGG